MNITEDLIKALEAQRANCKNVMTVLLTTGGRENILLADRVHKADDLARIALCLAYSQP